MFLCERSGLSSCKHVRKGILGSYFWPPLCKPRVTGLLFTSRRQVQNDRAAISEKYTALQQVQARHALICHKKKGHFIHRLYGSTYRAFEIP